MGEYHINRDIIIIDILTRWPQTVLVFLKYRMSCPGCLMASFETLGDVLLIYGVPVDLFMHELDEIIQASVDGKE